MSTVHQRCAQSASTVHDERESVSQVGKDAVVIEADAIKNRDAMYKHLSTSDFTRNDPMLSSYVHEYSTKAAEMLLAAAGGFIILLLNALLVALSALLCGSP